MLQRADKRYFFPVWQLSATDLPNVVALTNHRSSLDVTKTTNKGRKQIGMPVAHDCMSEYQGGRKRSYRQC